MLDFLELELSFCEKKIEVIIGDNASTDITYEEVCQHSLLDNENVFIYRNSTNLGLVGNLIELCKRANGEYIWFMGDDDIYRTGIVTKALGGISNEPALVFLNHEAYVEGQKDILVLLLQSVLGVRRYTKMEKLEFLIFGIVPRPR